MEKKLNGPRCYIWKIFNELGKDIPLYNDPVNPRERDAKPYYRCGPVNPDSVDTILEAAKKLNIDAFSKKAGLGKTKTYVYIPRKEV